MIKINEAQIQDHLGRMVRSTVEETLNAEADQLCGVKKYERSDKRINGRAGHYERRFHTKSGHDSLGGKSPVEYAICFPEPPTLGFSAQIRNL